MRRALHILLVLSVLWCGLHLTGESGASAATLDHGLLAEDCGKEGDADSESAAHMGHHHCPLAPDQRIASLGAIAPLGAVRGLLRIAALASLSQAPPLEPPAV